MALVPGSKSKLLNSNQPKLAKLESYFLQVLRALHIRPSTQMLSDILSRLVETVAEQGEDMQVCCDCPGNDSIVNIVAEIESKFLFTI